MQRIYSNFFVLFFIGIYGAFLSGAARSSALPKPSATSFEGDINSSWTREIENIKNNAAATREQVMVTIYYFIKEEIKKIEARVKSAFTYFDLTHISISLREQELKALCKEYSTIDSPTFLEESAIADLNKQLNILNKLTLKYKKKCEEMKAFEYSLLHKYARNLHVQLCAHLLSNDMEGVKKTVKSIESEIDSLEIRILIYLFALLTAEQNSVLFEKKYSSSDLKKIVQFLKEQVNNLEKDLFSLMNREAKQGEGDASVQMAWKKRLKQLQAGDLSDYGQKGGEASPISVKRRLTLVPTDAQEAVIPQRRKATPWYTIVEETAHESGLSTRLKVIQHMITTIEREIVKRVHQGEQAFMLDHLISFSDLETEAQAVYEKYSAISSLTPQEQELVGKIYKQILRIKKMQKEYKTQYAAFKKNEEQLLNEYAHDLHTELLDAVDRANITKVESCLKKVKETVKEVEIEMLIYSFPFSMIREKSKRIKKNSFLYKDLEKISNQLEKAFLKAQSAFMAPISPESNLKEVWFERLKTLQEKKGAAVEAMGMA